MGEDSHSNKVPSSPVITVRDLTVGYGDAIPPLRASTAGLYLCTMAQIYPEDRGQNYAVVYGERVAKALLDDLAEN